jgi:tetratricopeptide (TPR) repeat protein
VRVASSLALLLWAATPAHAEGSEAAATAQFDQGRALMKAGKFKEACEAFEKSQKLDPANGTLFNLAGCHEKIGKLASAWVAYRDLAQRDTNAKRKSESAKHAKDLDKRIPKLLLTAANPPAGMTVTLDGADALPLVGIENPVDLRDYKVVASAPGFQPFETVVAVKTEGKTITVKLELEKIETAGATKPATREPRKTIEQPIADTPARSHRTRNGAIVTALGGVAVGVGLVFGVKAKGKWDDAEALCPDKQCPTDDAKTAGDVLTDDARSAATLSTVFVVGGAAAAAVGIYFMATGNSSTTTALRVVPTTDGGAVVFGGRF